MAPLEEIRRGMMGGSESREEPEEHRSQLMDRRPAKRGGDDDGDEGKDAGDKSQGKNNGNGHKSKNNPNEVGSSTNTVPATLVPTTPLAGPPLVQETFSPLAMPPPAVSTTTQLIATPTTIIVVTTASPSLTSSAPALAPALSPLTSSSTSICTSSRPVLTLTTLLPPLVPSSTSSQSILSSTPTSVQSSPVPTSTLSAFPSTTLFSNQPESTSQPRKGVPPDFPPEFSGSSVSSTIIATAASTLAVVTTIPALADETSAPTASSIPSPSNNGGGKHHDKGGGNKHDNLSPTAQKLLIAAGAVGAFVIICAAVYFIARMYKRDVLYKFRGRRIRRGGESGRYGLRRNSQDSQFFDDEQDPPPRYGLGSDRGSINEKYQGKQDAGYYAPSKVSTPQKPGRAASPPRVNSYRQEETNDLLNAPLDAVRTSPVMSATEALYGVKATNTSATTEVYGQAATAPETGSLQPAEFQGDTMRSIQTNKVYDPAQREVNHLSYLSSLSSGFGDGLIIPDSGLNPAPQHGYRQTNSQFSWQRGSQVAPSRPVGDRDTIYTTTDEPPRFRTVNSWVAQQTGRVERHKASDAEIPSMPDLPANVPEPLQRKPSDAQFSYHPGDELPFESGTRVPSAILDKKTGRLE